MQSGLSLRIVPEHSRLYLGLVGATHAIALFGAFFNGLPLLIRSALLLIVGVSLIHSLLSYRRQLRIPTVLSFNDSDGWMLGLSGGKPNSMSLMASSVRTCWISILNFRKQTGESQSLIIFRDSVDAESYRKLQVLLKVIAVEQV